MFDLTLQLQEKSGQTLYEQLYQAIVQQIQEGTLVTNEKIPSKRFLCQHLGISQSTVETAYGMLVAEGYLEAKPRSGYRVASIVPLRRLAVSAERRGKTKERPAEPEMLAFSTGAVDTKIFPYASWAKIYKEVIYQSPELLQRGDAQGDLVFRETLQAFLQEYRGVRCDTEQIVVGAGMEYLLDLLLQLFPYDTAVALEDPGYSTAYRVVEHSGKKAIPVAVDTHGMRVDLLKNTNAQIAYVTPSHQFPMGTIMPAGRRSELLSWAEREEAWIIEDDYDSEFRYRSRPIPAMQGLDHQKRVIYIGTFSRSIAPSIRAAYMVLPRELLERYRHWFGNQASTISRFEQHALERFIRQGLYLRHLRRSTSLYKKRMYALQEALQSIPGTRISGEAAGLHFLLHIQGAEEECVVTEAARIGLTLHGLSEYCHGKHPVGNALVIGFAGLEEKERGQAVKLLKSAIAAARNKCS